MVGFMSKPIPLEKVKKLTDIITLIDLNFVYNKEEKVKHLRRKYL